MMKTLTILLLTTETKTELRRQKVTLTYFAGGQKLLAKQELLKTYIKQELDKLLAHFVLNIAKQNGDKYEPDTLTSLLQSFDHLLEEKEKTLQYTH